jgi:hypothetical protein
MIDIVQGLRQSAALQKAMNIYSSTDAEVAADEIERLRKRVAELEAILSREEQERQARLAFYKQALE